MAKTFPEPTAADATEALLVEDATALSATNRQAGARVAPYGILQVLAALPVEQRQEVAAAMLKTNSARNRSLTLMAAGLIQDALPTDLLKLQIRNSPANAAAVAVQSALVRKPDAATIAATRKRFDSMKAPLDASQRSLLGASVQFLTMLLDREDLARLTRAEKLAGQAKESDTATQEKARQLQRFVEQRRKQHARALELRTAKSKADASLDADEAGARSLLESKEALFSPPASSVSDADLATKPLSALLHGASWNYARVQQPGLFVATLRGLYGRLRGTSKLDSVVVRRIGASLSASLGLELFGADGGLDLSRPIECASPGDVDRGFVCSAYVEDPRAVRAQLAMRGMGSDTSLAMTMKMAEGGIMAPVLAAAAPLFLHGVIRESSSERSAKAKVVAEERLRTTESIAGRSLERLLIARADEDGHAIFDNEYYLFIGDRLLAFSGKHMATHVIAKRDTPSQPFDSYAAFQKASANWKDGASLQAFILGGAAVSFENETGLEIFADSEGLRVRVPAGERGEYSDASKTAALIPGTPVSQVSFGTGAAKRSKSSKSSKSSMPRDLFGDYDAQTVGTPPAMWLLDGAKRASFAWYTPIKGKLWSDWLLVVESNPRLGRALRSHRVRLPANGSAREVGGVVYAKTGSHVLVSTNLARMKEALVLARTPASRAPEFLSGSFDGKASAAAIRAMGAGLGTDLKNMFSAFAIYASVVKSADFRTIIRADAPPVFEGHLQPRLAEEGVDLEAVDQWLASPRIRNSATLPKPFTQKDLEKRLVLRFEVDGDPAAFVRSFAGLTRLKAKSLGNGEVEIVIEPGPRPNAAVPVVALSTRARKELLGNSGLLNPSHPRVKKLAAKIVPKGSSPKAAAKAIVGWIETNVEYEITPHAVDAIDVLDKKRGDCTEYSVLAVSLLRASGVPAELRQGMAVQNAEMVAHNWIAYHDGTGWREADPTAGMTYVGSGHIEASLLEFISLISVGGLKIVSAEVKK